MSVSPDPLDTIETALRQHPLAISPDMWPNNEALEAVEQLRRDAQEHASDENVLYWQ